MLLAGVRVHEHWLPPIKVSRAGVGLIIDDFFLTLARLRE